MNNNKAYWEALIRGLAWPSQEKSTKYGWAVFLTTVSGLFFLLHFM